MCVLHVLSKFGMDATLLIELWQKKPWLNSIAVAYPFTI